MGCERMRKLFKNKKGVTPVISAVIMILVVMIGMSALFAFFVNYSKDFQIGSGSGVLEAVTVEDLWFKNETAVEIWLYNYGKVDVKISDIYVNDVSIDFEFNDDIDDSKIAVGAHRNLTVSMPSAPGTGYHFKIVTARGTSFEGTYTR